MHLESSLSALFLTSILSLLSVLFCQYEHIDTLVTYLGIILPSWCILYDKDMQMDPDCTYTSLHKIKGLFFNPNGDQFLKLVSTCMYIIHVFFFFFFLITKVFKPITMLLSSIFFWILNALMLEHLMDTMEVELWDCTQLDYKNLFSGGCHSFRSLKWTTLCMVMFPFREKALWHMSQV